MEEWRRSCTHNSGLPGKRSQMRCGFSGCQTESKILLEAGARLISGSAASYGTAKGISSEHFTRRKLPLSQRLRLWTASVDMEVC